MNQELVERGKTIRSTVNENEGSCGNVMSSIHAMQIHRHKDKVEVHGKAVKGIADTRYSDVQRVVDDNSIP